MSMPPSSARRGRSDRRSSRWRDRGSRAGRFSERGRTGAYLGVIEPGRISAGDEIRVLEVPAHGVTVPQSFRALMGDRDLAGQILASGAGSETLRAELEGRQ